MVARDLFTHDDHMIAPTIPGRVLCAVDASDEARDAARVAARVARALDKELVLVCAGASPSAARRATEMLAVLEQETERTAQVAEATLAELGLGGRASYRLAFGEAGPLVARIARDEGADLVVVGSRRRGLLLAALFGSVSAGVARNAPCPVLVVPAGSAPRLSP